MHAAIYAFIAALIYSIENIIPKYLKRMDALDIMILRESGMLLPLTPFFISKFSYNSLLLIITGFLLGFIPYVAFLQALKIGKIGVVVAISQTHSLFAIIFSLLLFSTLPPKIYFIALVPMLASISILYLSKHQSLSFLPIIYALTAAILWGLQAVIIKHYFANTSTWNLVYFTELGLLLAALFYAVVKRKEITKPKAKDEYMALGVMAYGTLMAIYFYMKSLQLSEHASLPLIILTSSAIISSLWAYLIFKEKLKINEILAIILAITAIIIISL